MIDYQIERIKASDGSTRLKILKLQNLALRRPAQSPVQRAAIDAYKALEQQSA